MSDEIRYRTEGIYDKPSFARRGRKTLSTGQNYSGKGYGIIAYQDSEVSATINTKNANPDSDSAYSENLLAGFTDFGSFEDITCVSGRIAILLD